MRRSWVAGGIAAALLLSGAGQAGEWCDRTPAGFPRPLIPADNPMSAAKVALGRRLFHDPRLSGNGTISCASCHVQDLAFSDGRARSPGATGMTTDRNAPGLFNLAWLPTYTWANPALVTLERQAEVPLFGDDPVEMGVTDANRGEVLARLARDPGMSAGFSAAFPDREPAITFETLIQAIAAFERSIVTGQSRYDRFRQGQAELSTLEREGMELFFGKRAGCGECHGGVNFTDQSIGADDGRPRIIFHDAAIHGMADLRYPNRGVFELTGNPADLGRFRAPSLRNIALTAPYMHDGSRPSLADTLTGYARGALTAEEKERILAFLNTLTEPQAANHPPGPGDCRADEAAR